MKKIILTALLLFPVTALAQASPAQASLRLKDINGRELKSADYKGKVVLVNFWATWCIPCRTEIPDLIKLQGQYQSSGLRIVGVTYPPEEISDVRSFVRELNINYPVAIGTKETKSVFTSSETLPMTVVIDSRGEVRDVIEGIMYPDEFDQKVRPLLNNSAPSLPGQKGSANRSVGIQKVTILVGSNGYQPASVSLRRGIPAKLTFIRKTDETCAREIVIPGYGVNKPLPLNTPVLVSLIPKRAGRFKFTCGMNMFKGALIVR